MVRNRNPQNYGQQLRRGQTIAAEREHTISDSERLRVRQKAKQRKILSGAVIAACVLAIVAVIALNFENIFGRLDFGQGSVAPEKPQPSINIEDESGSNLVTTRMKEYLGQLEADFKDAGKSVARAVIPAGKTRELDIYLAGRDEFYKTNIDRDTAVTAEDAVRMLNYLDEHDLHPAYVDIRIPGKAYFR